jgi:hypothetical protein
MKVLLKKLSGRISEGIFKSSVAYHIMGAP